MTLPTEWLVARSYLCRILCTMKQADPFLANTSCVEKKDNGK
jgi:hypothetical protein